MFGRDTFFQSNNNVTSTDPGGRRASDEINGRSKAAATLCAAFFLSFGKAVAICRTQELCNRLERRPRPLVSSLDPLRRVTSSEVVIVSYKCWRSGLLTPTNIISSLGVEPKGLLNQGRNHHCAVNQRAIQSALDL